MEAMQDPVPPERMRAAIAICERGYADERAETSIKQQQKRENVVEKIQLANAKVVKKQTDVRRLERVVSVFENYITY